MERYIGLDAHSTSCTFAVMGPTGRHLREQVLETNGKVLVEFVRSVAGDRYLCLEEGAQSEWLYEVLEPYTKETVVVRPPRRPGCRSDSSDAWALADGYRTGRLSRAIFKAPKKYTQLVVDKPFIEQLLELDFLREGHNILFRGQAGVGKTTLGQHLGHRALEQGFTVRFSTLPAALADLLRQESLPATERRLKRYTTPDLLILDELGYVPCDARAADLFFRIVSCRHEQRSLVLTTNLAYKQWSDIFPDATCLSALIDRFAQHCHVVDIDADSWRQKSSLRRSPRKPRPKR